MKTQDFKIKTKKPVSHFAIYIWFVISAMLIVLNRFTALYINQTTVHFLLLFTAVSSFVIIIGHFFGKLKSTKSILSTFLAVGSICLLHAFISWGGDWKTESVLYENKDNPKKTVEFQLRGDRFAFGFKKRIIERNRIFPSIDWITDVDTTKLDPSTWENVK